VAIYIMIQETIIQVRGLNSLESVIWWFADPERVLWHAVGRVMRAVVQPLLQVFLGVIFKRLMGLNREGPHANSSQWSIIRRYINSQTLSQSALRRAFDIVGAHYQMTTWIWRAMGARIGKRVYWPGSGIYCPDPELLDIGDDVVFGSRSELRTSDGLGSKRIKIEAGAMIADRVVLLPGTHVGYRTVMGSGSLSTRDGYYPDGSTWVSLSFVACYSPSDTTASLDGFPKWPGRVSFQRVQREGTQGRDKYPFRASLLQARSGLFRYSLLRRLARWSPYRHSIRGLLVNQRSCSCPSPPPTTNTPQ
jgi:hypothetical protein